METNFEVYDKKTGKTEAVTAYSFLGKGAVEVKTESNTYEFTQDLDSGLIDSKKLGFRAKGTNGTGNVLVSKDEGVVAE